MSIAARMANYQLFRSSDVLDAYGIKSSTPVKIADIQVSITKNQPTHDYANPIFATTEYVGITTFVGVEEGDILQNALGTKYRIKDIGNKGTKYLPLFLDKVAA